MCIRSVDCPRSPHTHASYVVCYCKPRSDAYIRQRWGAFNKRYLGRRASEERSDFIYAGGLLPLRVVAWLNRSAGTELKAPLRSAGFVRMRSESTAVSLHVNRLRPRWFFQTFDTLNVTFPVSRTQSSAPKGSPQVLPRLREKEGKKVPGKMEQERQWRAKRLAHVWLRSERDALQTLCGACRRQERVIYCWMRCAQAGQY